MEDITVLDRLAMILGVNGIRLIGKRPGVRRALEYFLKCMVEIEDPFTEIRVYTPEPLGMESVSSRGNSMIRWKMVFRVRACYWVTLGPVWSSK